MAATENNTYVTARKPLDNQKYSRSVRPSSGGLAKKKYKYVTCVAMSAAHVKSNHRWVRLKINASTETNRQVTKAYTILSGVALCVMLSTTV